MVATLQGRPVPLSVLRAFDGVGGARLSRTLVAMLLLTARDADRPLQILPPCCRELSADEEGIAVVLTAMTREPAAMAAHWRALLGADPSRALLRHARAVGAAFKAAGLQIEIGAEFAEAAFPT